MTPVTRWVRPSRPSPGSGSSSSSSTRQLATTCAPLRAAMGRTMFSGVSLRL